MWIVFSLLAAFSTAVVVTLSKAGVKNIDSTLAFAVQSIPILIVSWCVVLWQGVHPEIARIDRRTWIFLAIAGVVTCLSSLASFRALKLGNASITSSFDRISLVFVVLFAVIFLKEKINWQLIVGALLMAAGAIIIAFSRQTDG